MTAETTNLLEQTRSAAFAAGERARSDPAYMQQLNDDPVGTLIAAGVPPETVGDVLREEGMSDDEVQGYLGTLPGTGGLPGAGALPGGPGGKLAHCGITNICLLTASGERGGGFAAGPGAGGFGSQPGPSGLQR